MDDKESLLLAFVGAAAIFSNTDFFGHLETHPAPGRSILEHALNREVAQGMNIAEAAASPAVLRTLEHFIYSSLCNAKKLSGGKYKSLYHFNSKADTIQAIQARLPKLAALMSSVQMGHYITTWKALPPMAPQKQADGSFLFVRPASPAAKWPLVVPLKDTGSFVKMLVDSPPGKHLLGASQVITWPEYTALWGKTVGVKAAFRQISSEEFFMHIPEPIKSELKASFDFIEEFGYTGGDPDLIMHERVSDIIDTTIVLTNIPFSAYCRSSINIYRGVY